MKLLGRPNNALRPQVQAIAALALAGLVLAIPSPAASEDNPMAPAEQGKLACYKPNVERKTCWVIIALKSLGDGKYETKVRARFHNTSDYETRYTTTMEWKDGRFCNKLDKAQYERAQFFHLGDEVIKQDLEDLRNSILDQAKNDFGKEFCDSYEAPDAKGLIKLKAYVDGVEQAPGTSIETMMWISPDDGYKLRPSPE
jgi:hypothetical protein